MNDRKYFEKMPARKKSLEECSRNQNAIKEEARAGSKGARVNGAVESTKIE